MGDEVWLYHHKVVMKDAKSFHPEPTDGVGGTVSNAWAWHQGSCLPALPAQPVAHPFPGGATAGV